MPVFEHPVQRLEVLGRGLCRLGRVGALVEIPVRAQPVFERGAVHELPDAARLRLRQSRRLERAFDQRDVREVERQTLGAERRLNHGQVLHAPRQAFGQELAQPALEQLDVAEYAVVGRDRNVVRRELQVGLHRLGRGRLRRARFECLDGQQRIDRGRFRLGLREPVARRERRLFEDADAIDEPIEVLAQPGIPAGAVRRLEQGIERPIEFSLGAQEVADREFLAACLEMPVRRRDQDRNRIRSRFWSWNRGRNRRGRLRDDLRGLGAWSGCATRDQQAPITGTTVRCLLLGIQSDGKWGARSVTRELTDWSKPFRRSRLRRWPTRVYEDFCRLAGVARSRGNDRFLARPAVFGPLWTARRTSSSQTNCSGSLFAGSTGSRRSSGSRGFVPRPREARNLSIRFVKLSVPIGSGLGFAGAFGSPGTPGTAVWNPAFGTSGTFGTLGT